ncbi:uncharacterized protein [Apostichopus japonicus]|uniref:uncharacterized protein n=1 Tax=Stichopus japonicus TaxID=307972 RepID=UPI003AB80578
MRSTRKAKQGEKQRQQNDEAAAIDDELQQKLLEQLNAYGNQVLGDDGRISRASNQKSKATLECNKVKKQRTNTTEDITSNNVRNDGNAVAKKKRKKAWEENLNSELINFSKKSKLNLKEENDDKRKNGPEVIVFEDRAKRKKISEADQEATDESFVTSKGHLRELSHEVYQFGLSGFDFENKEKLEMQRAIKLGAKPPKNTHVPYKEFMKLQKEKKQEELKQREIDRKMGMQVKKKSSDRDRKRELILRKSGFWQDSTKKRNFIADGQVGKFKSGVQVLSKQDIHQIKRGKGRTRGGKRKTKSR